MSILVKVFTLVNGPVSPVWKNIRNTMVAPPGYTVEWECDRCAVITTGRNLQLKKAVAASAARAIFIDSDVILSQEAFDALVTSSYDIEGVLYPFRRSVQTEDGIINPSTLVGSPDKFNLFTRKPKTLMEYLTLNARKCEFFKDRKTPFLTPAWWVGAGALSISLHDADNIVPFSYYRISGCDTGEDLVFCVTNKLVGRSVMARYIPNATAHLDCDVPELLCLPNPLLPSDKIA